MAKVKRLRAKQQAERLTWEEICRRFPDQWVFLVDVDGNSDDGEFKTAVVLGSARGRDESWKSIDPVSAGYSEFAHRFTGRIRAPLYPVNLVLF